MEEMRQLVQEEGREARNIVAFHVPVDTPARRKPPRALPARRPAPRRAAPRRSASAGRDKRSDLRARYWALLFGDLRRSIGEIYNTVETHESLSECQEVILVLQNYTRDFIALCEWFRLKWEYDNTPPPQRPQSLAWEIRKTDFVRPESRRAHSVKSSPTVSGKNSPCFSGYTTPSGKNSPNPTGKTSPGSGKISPRLPNHSNSSPKTNLEFFSNKVASKVASKPEPKSAKDNRLSDIKEKVLLKDGNDVDKHKKTKDDLTKTAEVKTSKECPNNGPVAVKTSPIQEKPDKEAEVTNGDLSSAAKATIMQLNMMECSYLEKQLMDNFAKNDNLLNKDKDDSSNAGANKECAVTFEESGVKTDSPTMSEDNFADVSNESSVPDDKNALSIDGKLGISINKIQCNAEDTESTGLIFTEPKQTAPDVGKSINVPPDKSDTNDNNDTRTDLPEKCVDKDKNNDLKSCDAKTNEVKSNARPAYSQAAAKPKLVIAKAEAKPTVKTTSIVRSKTVVEIRPASAPKAQKTFPKRNQTGKCSYPFNLTTGRTSLFDNNSSGINKASVRKPVNKNIPSGDQKLKTDEKKPQQKRPTSLKINEKGDKEKLNPQLERIKDCEEYSSSDTIVTQIDMSRIESSESLKTLVPDDDVAHSMEVLNLNDSKNDDDGWLTVKSRRLSRESKKQSKSHWASRFHQPSATTSLPTLNMLESPKQESKSVGDTKFDRAKSEQPENSAPPLEHSTAKIHKATRSKEEKFKQQKSSTAIIRQKSDVTGLKTRSARNKAFLKKSERMRDAAKVKEGAELSKNRLHSSLESLTGLSRSQESTEEPFDFDKWKEEFKSYFKYAEDEEEDSPNHNEILKSADPSEMSEIAEMTSQIEENERRISLALDFQSEYDQRKLSEEEDLLNRQIMELQQVSDVDLDTETDDTETDAELARTGGPDGADGEGGEGGLGALSATLEHQYETALAGMSWAERVDTLVMLEQLVARDPGRAQQLHTKLSQGIKRRGSLQDALRRLQAKQARAERQRLDLQTGRTKKIHSLLTRVEEVKTAKNQLIEEKRLRMERRLQKAAENRDQHLKDIVRKAHDEEEKLREIAFIKQLQAENRRHEFLEQCRAHTARLRRVRRERLQRLEHAAAREAAVGARRLALQEARRRHVETLLERRKVRDARVEELKELKRQERDDAAREKAEGVKSRLSALAAAAELEAESLRSRIRDKQDASQLRLETHLQNIRTRAAPTRPTTSECQETALNEEEELELQAQVKKEREKQKSLNRRARKLRQKLIASANEFERTIDDNDLTYRFQHYLYGGNKIYRSLVQINNILAPYVTRDSKIDTNGHSEESEKKNKLIDDVDKILAHINGTEKKKNKKKKMAAQNTDENSNKDVESKNIIATDIVIQKGNETVSKKKIKKKNKSDNIDLIDKNTTNNDEKTLNENKPKFNADKVKLSKASSIASSTSDMSKLSVKSDKRRNRLDDIDWIYLEKTLNELNRLMERSDMNTQELLIYALKTLNQLLALAIDKDETGIQVSIKSLVAAAQTISKVLVVSSIAAAYLLNTGCVHIAKLLALLLEREELDKNSLILTRQLADCLSLSLDSALCNKQMELSLETRQKIRAAALQHITYLCLSGCLTRAEYATGEAKESMQALTTVCADNLHPSDVDTSPQDRQTALNNLRSALELHLGGARAQFCQLFARGAALSSASGASEFVRAARTAHLLSSLAKLDHRIVQEAFSSGRWPLEFRAAVARLLAQHAPTDLEPPRHQGPRATQRLDQSLSETMVLDLIILIGFVVVNNTQHQETIISGWSAVKTLCTLPANWIVAKPQCKVLLPTLAALAQYPPAAAVIGAELSLKMIEEYIESDEAKDLKLVQVIKEGKKQNTPKRKTSK